ncbi:hypothetical protein [Streptosporangium sp. 'caverna']|uniref:hypothetical protein n=1 Tax=Streptosporangium sp. 'caverna' TaxID=2202249 RepID=UPI000D7DDC24|nr:hypothetical protein [Streptosporangium sp. 'caverna']AWS46202.1 hypothetical protein DKM19_37830 [Streptosporangium sp. 'caverna']
MRQLRKVILRILCVTLLLVSGLAATATSAQAAVPDRWGFAYVNAYSGIPSPAHQAGSWSVGFNVSVTPGAVGQSFVRFPQIATTGGVVHVTAVAQDAYWCQAQNWGPSGPDLVVAVQCYRYGGAPVFAQYTVVFETSTGTLPVAQGFGYVHYNGAFIAGQFNSVSAPNSVTGGGGSWTVSLPGLGSPAAAGNIQVTAVNPTQPARCKVAGWTPTASGQMIQVRCFNATNVPLNTGWTLTYQRERAITGAAIPPKNFAYTFDLSSAPGPYAPTPVGINHNSQLGVNTVQSSGVGLRMVLFPQVAAAPTHVQATAFGPGPEFCNLQTLWTLSGTTVFVRNVACYSAGTRVSHRSMTTYTSAF